MKISILPLLFAAGHSLGAPVPLVNPSGEINGGASPGLISAAAVTGWDSDWGQVIRNGADYGNGAWRLSFEDSQHIRQMTGHVIAAGDGFSLRCGAAMFVTGSSGDTLPLIGGGLRNGNFNADASATDSRPFEDTPDWTNLGGAQTAEATRSNLAVDGSRNAALHRHLSAGGRELFAEPQRFRPGERAAFLRHRHRALGPRARLLRADVTSRFRRHAFLVR